MISAAACRDYSGRGIVLQMIARLVTHPSAPEAHPCAEDRLAEIRQIRGPIRGKESASFIPSSLKELHSVNRTMSEIIYESERPRSKLNAASQCRRDRARPATDDERNHFPATDGKNGRGRALHRNRRASPVGRLSIRGGRVDSKTVARA